MYSKEMKEISYLSFLDFYYHLSQIGKILVDILVSLEKGKEIKFSDVLQKFSQVNPHLEEIPLFLSGARSFSENYELLREKMKDRVKKGDPRTSLESQEREYLLIEIYGLLEQVFSLIAMGRKSLPAPSELKIPATIFPKKLEVAVGGVKVPEDHVNRTFIIGRVTEDAIGIRRFPYEMLLEELIDAAMDETKIESSDFAELWSSKKKLERQFDKGASRMHVLIYPEKDSIQLIDISATSSIIYIDGYTRQIIGCRAGKFLVFRSPPISLQLGRINKLWIDPIKKFDGILVEIKIHS